MVRKGVNYNRVRIPMGVSPLSLAGVRRGLHLLATFGVFEVGIDGRKRPWWIVGSLPHQKKPRLLVSLVYVPHFKEGFSFLRFEDELSGRLGTFPLPVSPGNHEYQ